MDERLLTARVDAFQAEALESVDIRGALDVGAMRFDRLSMQRSDFRRNKDLCSSQRCDPVQRGANRCKW